MRCLIIDDEPLALELLEDNIKKIPNLVLVGMCRNAVQAIQIMQEQPVDLIFCDIQMPGINGLQLVRSMQQKPLVIFVTAYQEFAIDGFELDVVDYLLKPVALDRFLKACNKAITIFEANKRQSHNTESAATTRRFLFLYADYNLIKISHDDITYIEGLKDYVKLYATNLPKPILSRITIKSLEEQLPAADFYRVHKSYIVNLNHVHSIRKGRIKVADAEVPYSDNYKDAISRMTGKVQ
ncbi:LytR/AlgR family response regulator transcription factor [Mucilaginibacter terrae]|uniref:DNA-binding LytR/AlgR family response regulator n=1 Tax=Mucilaginibacter terrae TaxID=1955052 RepID=A0ABU3GPZ9_9SPHI|nr:LytTR family DNA-binding domain-containing protein [Mucilaginibacter terrae]MDT3401606.1 DNA-binding LytR/AlgR family response regulator [Mucilaginibacter terrae]